MILLCGPLSDPVLHHFVAYLSAEGIDYVFLDQRLFGQKVHLEWTIKQGSVVGFIDYGQWQVELKEISGVFIRWETEENLGPYLGDTKEEQFVARFSLYYRLAMLLDILPCVVVNRPYAMLSNRSKPYQLGLIRKWGFHIPCTMVTNDPTKAERFYRERNGNVIVKSLGTTRSVVRKLSESDLSRLDLLTACPIQLQELIHGTNVRVHVMGEKVFAIEICTDAIDYRYAEDWGFNCKMHPIKLPTELAERCIGLTRLLGLHIAGIDLYELPNGQWGCFEVNTSPAFTWFENQARQMLCLTLATQLIEHS